MLHILVSSLHHEALPVPDLNADFVEHHQVVAVMTGGTEQLFLAKVQQGEIDIHQPVYLVAGGQSNSLAACCEILSWINQHGGTGEMKLVWKQSN
ncbi:MAG: hypothetical protein MJZ75_03145 [Paludibacteraceae bacterium]|nr:hypothetical protein [Paludibacteraceae bacterium]